MNRLIPPISCLAFLGWGFHALAQGPAVVAVSSSGPIGSASPSALPSPAPSASAPSKVWSSCEERVPDGATRPELKQVVSEKGLIGHAVTLKVTLTHQLGETVLPAGLKVNEKSDTVRELRDQGFHLPHPEGSAPPTLERVEANGNAVTTLTIPLLALPPKPGRQTLELPPIPIAVSRANGEVITLCTSPAKIDVEDPIANEPDAKPKGNPPARPQRELWTLARDLTYGGAVGAVLAGLAAWLVVWWLRRPKAPAPPPPPEEPWVIALRQLQATQQAGLLDQGLLGDYVDRVTDTLRWYLGARYGFDGIESTSEEILHALRQSPLPHGTYETVRALLSESDLVKFARLAPAPEDCVKLWETVRVVITETTPAPTLKGQETPAREEQR